MMFNSRAVCTTEGISASQAVMAEGNSAVSAHFGVLDVFAFV